MGKERKARDRQGKASMDGGVYREVTMRSQYIHVVLSYLISS